MKKVLPLAIAAALVAPTAALADATVYGQIHVAIEDYDRKIGGGLRDFLDEQGLPELNRWLIKDTTEINSRNSRVGIKGSEDLGNGLKGIYQLEFAVDVAEDGAGGLDRGRNQYVGLAGGFGTILGGRHDTPLKMSQGKFDVFNDTVADITGVIPGEERLGNVLAYISPDWAGFTLAGAMVAGEQGDGDPDELTSIADHYSLAGLYSNGPFYAALAYNQYKTGVAVDEDLKPKPTLWRLTGVYKGDMFSIGGMYSEYDYDSLPNDTSKHWGLSGSVKLGPGDIKGMYLQGDNPVAKISDLGVDFSPNVTLPVPAQAITDGLLDDMKTTQWTLGYDYNFSKRTSLYALYNAYKVEVLANDIEDNTFAIGAVHKF
jgi:predicted porin